MQENSIDARLFQVLKDIFEIGEECEPTAITQDGFADWDSIGHIRLIVALENEFNIKIPIEKAVDFNTFEMISEYLKNSGLT